MAKMNDNAGTVARIKIGSYLKRWVNDAFHDFDEDLQNRFLHFANNHVAHTDPKLATQIIQALTTKQQGKVATTASPIFEKPAPPVFTPKLPITSLLDLNPLEIARQMTLTDYDFCKKIEAKECLGLGWTKKDKQKRSPNLLAFVQRFNHVSTWVAVTLTSQKDKAKRIKLLSHFIQILQHLKELNNFNGIFQIVGGLGNSSVYRLTKTFAGVDKKQKKNFGRSSIHNKTRKSMGKLS